MVCTAYIHIYKAICLRNKAVYTLPQSQMGGQGRKTRKNIRPMGGRTDEPTDQPTDQYGKF